MNCRTYRSFTLLEMLAVIVLLSLVAAVATVSLASAGMAADFARTIAQFHQADFRGRLHARVSSQAVLMALNSDPAELALVAQHSGERLSEFATPSGIAAQIMIGDGTTPGPAPGPGPGPAPGPILFDRLGHSQDYQVVLKSSARNTRLAVCGLTGSIRQEEIGQ